MRSFEEGFAEGLGLGLIATRDVGKHCIRCEQLIPKDAKICPICGATQPPTEW